MPRTGNNKNNIFKNFTMLINKIVMTPFTTLNKDKNTTQSETYIIQKNVNSSLEKEIKELKVVKKSAKKDSDDDDSDEEEKPKKPVKKDKDDVDGEN